MITSYVNCVCCVACSSALLCIAYKIDEVALSHGFLLLAHWFHPTLFRLCKLGHLIVLAVVQTSRSSH